MTTTIPTTPLPTPTTSAATPTPPTTATTTDIPSRRRRPSRRKVDPGTLTLLLLTALFLSPTLTAAFLAPLRPSSAFPTAQKHLLQPITHRSSRTRGLATVLLEPPQRYGSQDWIENLRSLIDSRIAKRISGHLAFNTLWAAGITALYEYMPQWHIGSHISPIPHQLMSSALGLLLVFRTNAAYDRFWEARKVWGSVTNVCRNLARTGRIALDRRYHARFSMLVIAFAVTLRAHLQRTVVSTELEGLLPSWEADQVRIDSCPPALVCMKLTHLINEAVTQNEARSDFYALYLEQLVGELINCLGMAERILLTPVPASYSRHTSRFLSLYTLTLPFVLVHQLEFFTAPALGAICWGLFSIEEIGHLIEEPFCPSTNQLPLERMTQTISRDVKQLLRISEGVDFSMVVEDDLLSPEDRLVAENAPFQSFPRWAPDAAEPEGGGLVMGASSLLQQQKREAPLTAASAASSLQSTETMNI